MAKEQKHRTKPYLSDESGQNLFTESRTPFFHETDLPELLKKVQGFHDDRLFAIVTALVVENRINRLLRAVMPRFHLIEQRSADFSASMREIMLDSLGLISPLAIQAAAQIRNIRNKFAHNLDYKTFDDLPAAKCWNSFRDFHDRHLADLAVGHSEDKSRAAIFGDTVMICVGELDEYYPSLKFLNDEMRKPETVENVKNAIAKLNTDAWEQMQKSFASEEG